jgi:glycosyltransferase involved in cell wall biosynthesis
MKPVSLTYSLADQDFERTKSIGIFNVSVQLAEALAVEPNLKELTILANQRQRSRLNLPAQTTIAIHDEAAGRGLSRIRWDQWRVYQAAQQSGCEWLFLPKGFASFVRTCPLRLTAYVHDVMQEVYANRYPQAMPRLERLYFQKGLRATVQQAEVIFTNSEFTASEVRRLARESGWCEPRVHCAGIGFRRVAENDESKQDRIVVLTSVWPHKRTDLALAWVRRWQEQSGFRGSIELVGSLPVEMRCPDYPGWRHHQRLGEEDYRRLLRTARALVYFSDYEGFGMPPIEATLAGTAAVYSELPATRESMGRAGLPFSNADFDSFKKAMNEALSLAQNVVKAWAEELLTRHTWEGVAKRIINALAQMSDAKR